MPLYLVERTDPVDFDQYAGFVVRAKNEEEARELAAEGRGRTWPVAALGPNVEVTKLAFAGESEVILASFIAG